eukprot:47121_1
MYMSICDVIFIFIRTIGVTNPAFNWSFMSKTPIVLCKTLGICEQLFGTCSATWNVMIAACVLLPLLRGANEFQTITQKKHKTMHIIFVVFITIVTVLIPVAGNAFGFTDNNASHYGLSKWECWIKKTQYFKSIMIPITAYVSFSILLLIYSLFIIYFNNTESLSRLRSQLIWYTVVFVCVWIPTPINRFYNETTNSSSFILTCCQMISLHSIGCANAAVWYHYYMKRLHLQSDISDHTGTYYTDIKTSTANAESIQASTDNTDLISTSSVNS